MKISVLLATALAQHALAWSANFLKEFSNVRLSPYANSDYSTLSTQLKQFERRASTASINGTGIFQQPVDHSNAYSGTFKQRFLWSTQFWKGPGAPVVVITTGTNNADFAAGDLVSEATIYNQISKKLGAALLIVETRYFGESSPYTELTTANMKYLTVDQAIQDLVNFARNFKAPWQSDLQTAARDVPWVLVGQGTGGSFTNFVEATFPGTYWAYYSSSAELQAIDNYPEYFYPIQKYMSQNCSKDINLVIDYMDGVIVKGNPSAIADLKKKFMLQDVAYNDDFMAAIANPLYAWEFQDLTTGYSPFYQFCDYVENAVNKSGIPSTSGVGLQKALQGYADWFTQVFLPDSCSAYGYSEFNGTYNTKCYNTHDPKNPIFTDTSVTNFFDSARQFVWVWCNEPFGWNEVGAPRDRPSLVSRLITAAFYDRQCSLFFPRGSRGETVGIAGGRTFAATNQRYKGWNDRPTQRILYVTAERDPWKDTGVASSIRPGGPLQSTMQRPIIYVPGGFHGSDYYYAANAAVSAEYKLTLDRAVGQIARWVLQWKKGSTGNGRGYQTYTA